MLERGRRRPARAWLLVLMWALAVVLGPRELAAAPPEDFVPPEVIEDVEITYPEGLVELDSPPHGVVVIKLTVGIDGVPMEVEVEQGLHPELDALAMQAAQQLRYAPGTVGGVPIEVTLRTTIEFDPPAPAELPTPQPEVETPPESTQDATATTGPVRITGQLLEAGQRVPIGGATVLAVAADADEPTGRVRKQVYGEQAEPAWQVRTFTDAEGRFALNGIPDGKTRIIVLASGYERLEFVESLPTDQSIAVRYYATRLASNPYRTVVKTRGIEREEVARRTITPEEIRNLPGTQGDALKSIQNFPGMARSPFGIGLLVIRGSDPSDSAVYLGEHEIPQLFHFGGLRSVFNADMLSHIDFIPGNFDARFGDAIGGIVDVGPRKGRRDGYHGYADTNLFDSGVLFEGPVGEGSFALSARRSYIDLLLPAVVPDDAGLDLTIAPRYWDYQALLDYPVSRGNLSVRVFGSDDRTKLLISGPNEVETDTRNRFETTLSFHRADLAYTNHRGQWDFLITPSYRHDFLSAGIGDLFRFKVTTHTFSSRVEAGYRASRHVRWDIGTQLFAGTYTIDAEAPAVPGGGQGSADTILQTSTKNGFAAPAVYGSATFNLGSDFTLVPSARVTHYALNFSRTTVDPRMRFHWQVADRTAIKGGVGIYSQIPDPFEWNSVWGNPLIRPEQALHTSLGIAQSFDPGITVEVTGFYKVLWDLASPSQELVRSSDGSIRTENFANTGLGRIVGGELFVRKELTRNFFGWLSYTISRSERRPDPASDWQLFGFDQTHIFTLIAVHRLPKNWQIGARFRLVSGNPYTPIVGALYDASSGGYVPVYGEINSARVDTFHQLDLRVDKRFVWKRVMLTTYLDVQNAYNAQNPEFMQQSYDLRHQQPIPSLPIIPSLGARLEF
jgi:TonB family protein